MTLPGTQDRSTRKLSYTIREDWKFYLIALLPYFLAIFALWILLDEGFIAHFYELEIEWALPLLIGIHYVFPYWLYFLFGLIALLSGMMAIWIVILFVQRKPRIDKAAPKGTFLAFIDRSRGWIRGKYPLRIITGLGFILLAIGLIFAGTTFILLQQRILDQALFYHQWSDITIIIAMVITFILIVCERGEE